MKTLSRVILSAIFFALTGVLILAARCAPALVFSFYPDFSRRIIAFLSAVTSPFPFALWEILVLLVILWSVYTLIRSFVRCRGFLRWLSGVLLAFSAALFFFTAVWGFGHLGPGIGEQLNLDVREYTEDELISAARYYAEQANDYAVQVNRDRDGVVAFSAFHSLAAQAGQGYEKLSEQYPCFNSPGVVVKRLTAWKLYSYFGVTGIFMPFTGESGVNPDAFEASLPFTMCHELAHRFAFPAEDDANFCAYLACMANPSPEFRYSGAYSAFLYCYNALYEVSPSKAALVWETASPQLRADCHAASVHYEPYEGAVQDAAQAVNDAYLKAFQEEEGVKSYGAAADYLIAWYLDAGKQTLMKST